MPLYMTQFAYTAEAWAGLVKKPEDRSVAVSNLIKKLGGRVIGLYYHFGEYDGTLLFEAPDDLTANAGILAAITPGHLKATKTTRLFTIEEMMEATIRAGKQSYKGPAGMQ